jgi:hypothetical protein
LAAFLLDGPGEAQGTEVAIPDAVKPFVAPGTEPLDFQTADLNRDGRLDAILVLQAKRKPIGDGEPDDEDPFDNRPRPLLILVGQRDGTYREVKRNDKIVHCRGCGGNMGDPFQGVTAAAGRFSVMNAGGTGSRWDVTYSFSYSRRDDTWLLVEIDEGNWNVGDPDAVKRTVSKSPRDFGKIDISTFVP